MGSSFVFVEPTDNERSILVNKLIKQLHVEVKGRCDGEHDWHDRLYLYEDDYPNIYKDHEITTEEVADALDIIATYMMQNKNYKIVLDFDERNRCLAPPKEMTLKDIEKALGYKVKIVKEK